MMVAPLVGTILTNLHGSCNKLAAELLSASAGQVVSTGTFSGDWPCPRPHLQDCRDFPADSCDFWG
jgi:hypothetical protein